ncbi:hypothetical protein OOK41_00040 [Micromonospora sp. NBC_01655]|uniref:hypothetical protein n=1 Tax=Micromonospora sp. NBC_01655 TaxID=2975983 RepID=UPI00224D90F1|nr:hypothetical protein [Micromonospora sp. NBC_01655]MCX4468720.1 hypothetical protein [Micromonospora sp. NBC_01655]
MTRMSLPARLTLISEALKDPAAGELEAIDAAIEAPLAAFMPHLERGPLKLSQARWVAAWLAMRQATGSTRRLTDFQVRLLRAELVREDEQRPPAGGTSGSSSEVAG